MFLIFILHSVAFAPSNVSKNTAILRIFLKVLFMSDLSDAFSRSPYTIGEVSNYQEIQRPSRGDIICFSCFSLYSPKPSYSLKNETKTVARNSSEFRQITSVIQEAGLTLPNYMNTCADASPFQATSQLLRASVHVCRSTLNSPGSCVKLKGQFNDKVFVYRECWERMWIHTRPYHQAYSGYCIAGSDQVKNFIRTNNSLLCFCEGDLCNGVSKTNSLSYLYLANFIIVINLMYFYHNYDKI